jgi:4-hydroxy-3-polyprenylbenzoate decarboxylase
MWNGLSYREERYLEIEKPTRVAIGITGASGSIYGVSVIRLLLELGIEVHLILSGTGEQVLEYECGINAGEIGPGVIHHDVSDLFAPVASGTYPVDSMAIVPCSMNTLGMLANGLAPNLLLRCADVMLKERRPLIIVPRETPLNASHLENMLKLNNMGARIVPLAPALYHRPTNLKELIAPTVARIASMLGVNGLKAPVWTGGSKVPGTAQVKHEGGEGSTEPGATFKGPGDAAGQSHGEEECVLIKVPRSKDDHGIEDYRVFIQDLVEEIVRDLLP